LKTLTPGIFPYFHAMLALIRNLSSRLVTPVLWTLLIIVLLSVPGSAIPKVSIGLKHVDKLVHFILFGIFPVLWSYYFIQRRGKTNSNQLIILFCVISILFGISLEYVQHYFVVNRDFDVVDIIADSLGAIVFGIVLILVERNYLSAAK
jgi:VanZ family protein